MNILFYTPINFRCRDIESLAEKFIAQGHRVFLLSQCPEGIFHESLRKLGVTTSAWVPPDGSAIVNTYRHVKHLLAYCRKNKIDVAFSHLEPTNFISVLAQYFITTRFIIYRHHIAEAKFYGFDQSFSYRFTYKRAESIICVSRQARDYMIEEERVKPERIYHINLGYNFSLYDAPVAAHVREIRERFQKGILLVCVGRLTKYKRPELAIELIAKAKKTGIEASLLFLGLGDEEKPLKELAASLGVSDCVSFAGYTHRILDYLESADLLIHPSLLESSCVVIKEASLVELPVIVCNGVGDFDDYMRDGVNGSVVEPSDFVNATLKHLVEFQKNREPYKSMARELKGDIVSRFSIENTIGKYSRFIGNA